MPTKPDSPETCPHCSSTSLYESETNASGFGIRLLPWLGILHNAMFRVVVCSECGATQFFADRLSRAKLAKSDKWKRL